MDGQSANNDETSIISERRLDPKSKKTRQAAAPPALGPRPPATGQTAAPPPATRQRGNWASRPRAPAIGGSQNSVLPWPMVRGCLESTKEAKGGKWQPPFLFYVGAWGVAGCPRGPDLPPPPVPASDLLKFAQGPKATTLDCSKGDPPRGNLDARMPNVFQMGCIHLGRAGALRLRHSTGAAAVHINIQGLH